MIFAKVNLKSIIVVATCVSQFYFLHAQVTSARITGYVVDYDMDTVDIIVHKEFGNKSNGYLPIDTIISCVTDNGYFDIEVSIQDKIGYITIEFEKFKDKGYNPFTNFMVERGDSIHVLLKNGDEPVFSGNNSEKFAWYYDTWQFSVAKRKKQLQFIVEPQLWLQVELQLLETGLNSLEKIRDELGEFSYSILRADYIAICRLYQYRIFKDMDFGYSYGAALGQNASEIYRNSLYRRVEDTGNQPVLELSAFYASYLMQKTLADIEFDKIVENRASNVLDYIDRKYSDGLLKDRIVVAYLFQGDEIVNDEFFIARDSLVSSQKYLQTMDRMYSTFSYGSPVDDKTIFKDPYGNSVRLSDYNGKVVYIDLWFSGCSGCVSAAQALPMVEEAFKNDSSIVFVSISIDKSKERWLNSILPKGDKGKRASGASNYSHFVTENTIYLYTSGTGDNNSFIKQINPKNTYPCMLIVGKDGRIFKYSPPRPEEQNGELLIATLREALALD